MAAMEGGDGFLTEVDDDSSEDGDSSVQMREEEEEDPDGSIRYSHDTFFLNEIDYSVTEEDVASGHTYFLNKRQHGIRDVFATEKEKGVELYSPVKFLLAHKALEARTGNRIKCVLAGCFIGSGEVLLDLIEAAQGTPFHFCNDYRLGNPLGFLLACNKLKQRLPSSPSTATSSSSSSSSYTYAANKQEKEQEEQEELEYQFPNSHHSCIMPKWSSQVGGKASMGVFHPKYLFIFYEDRVALAIGSNNLSLPHSLELTWTDIVYAKCKKNSPSCRNSSSSSGSSSSGSFLDQLQSFLLCVSKDHVSGGSDRDNTKMSEKTFAKWKKKHNMGPVQPHRKISIAAFLFNQGIDLEKIRLSDVYDDSTICVDLTSTVPGNFRTYNSNDAGVPLSMHIVPFPKCVWPDAVPVGYSSSSSSRSSSSSSSSFPDMSFGHARIAELIRKRFDSSRKGGLLHIQTTSMGANVTDDYITEEVFNALVHDDSNVDELVRFVWPSKSDSAQRLPLLASTLDDDGIDADGRALIFWNFRDVVVLDQQLLFEFTSTLYDEECEQTPYEEAQSFFCKASSFSSSSSSSIGCDVVEVEKMTDESLVEKKAVNIHEGRKKQRRQRFSKLHTELDQHNSLVGALLHANHGKLFVREEAEAKAEEEEEGIVAAAAAAAAASTTSTSRKRTRHEESSRASTNTARRHVDGCTCHALMWTHLTSACMSLGAQGKRRNPDKTNKLTCSYDEYRNYELGVFFSSTDARQLYALNCACQVHDPRSKNFRGLETEREQRAGVVILPIPFSLRSNPFAVNQRVLELVECDVDATSDGFLPRNYFYEEKDEGQGEGGEDEEDSSCDGGGGGGGGVGGVGRRRSGRQDVLETIESHGKMQFNRISNHAKETGKQREWKVAETQREPGVREEKGIVKVLEMQQIFHHEQIAQAPKANKKKSKINMLEVFTQQDFHVDDENENGEEGDEQLLHEGGEEDEEEEDYEDAVVEEEEEEEEGGEVPQEGKGQTTSSTSKSTTTASTSATASMPTPTTATAQQDDHPLLHASQQSQTSTPSKSQDASLLIF